MQQQPQRSQTVSDFRTAMNITHFAFAAWDMALTLPMRQGCGRNHIGVNGLTAIVFTFLWAGFGKAPTLLYWIPIFLVSCTFHQAQQLRARRRGEHIHTRYCGYPISARRLLFILGVKNERALRLIGEPLMALLVGYLWVLFTGDRNAFFFFAFGFVPMWTMQSLNQQAEQVKVNAMRDGMIEQQHLMNLLREGKR